MQTNTQVICIIPSIINIPTKPIEFHTLSTSSLTRAINSPVLFLSKYRIDNLWICLNKFPLISLAIFTLAISKINSLLYWNIALPSPMPSKDNKKPVSSSICPPTITLSIIFLVTIGAHISSVILITIETMAIRYKYQFRRIYAPIGFFFITSSFFLPQIPI